MGTAFSGNHGQRMALTAVGTVALGSALLFFRRVSHGKFKRTTPILKHLNPAGTGIKDTDTVSQLVLQNVKRTQVPRFATRMRF